MNSNVKFHLKNGYRTHLLHDSCNIGFCVKFNVEIVTSQVMNGFSYRTRLSFYLIDIDLNICIQSGDGESSDYFILLQPCIHYLYPSINYCIAINKFKILKINIY